MFDYIVERDFSDAKRKELAKSGAALPDGSFPIENKSDLENAVKAVGRASNPSAAKAHIKKRAKALGFTDCLPDTWESWVTKDGEVVQEATYAQSDSHSGLRDKLNSAIDGKVQSGQDMDGDDDGEQDAKDRQNSGYPLTYVQQVHDKHVIYAMNGKTFAHKYTKDGDGDPHLTGSPQEVEPSYETKAPAKAEAGKESFSEACAFEAGSMGGNKGLDLLCESFSDKGEITFTVIKPGLSKNNRYYSPEMLKRDAHVFEGAKMFADHATDKEVAARPEGSVKDWIANVTKVWPESDGTVKANAVVIDPTMRHKMKLLGEAGQLHTLGVSIRAIGSSKDGEYNGQKCKVIEGFKKAVSVDFVTFAGAGGQVDSLQ